MRQRTMIAMALACDPAVIIGDEPTTALDVMVQAQILELFERLRHELGLSLILITHDLSVIAETCDRVLVMYAGKVAEEGPVGTVFRDAAPPLHRRSSWARSRTSARTGARSRSSPASRRTSATRRRPAASRRAAPWPGTSAARWRRPRSTMPDGVRVACHLWPAGSDGVTPGVDDTQGRGRDRRRRRGVRRPGRRDGRTSPVA